MTDFITDPVEKEKALEDLGRPVKEKPITFAYTVIVDKDGAIHTQISEKTDEVARKATVFDVYSTSRDLVNDIESQLLADRVAKAVAETLKPADSTQELREKLISALSDRGIETPKA